MGRGEVPHMQACLGEMIHQSRSESEGDDVSAIATGGTQKQTPGRGAETDDGDGTCCESLTSL